MKCVAEHAGVRCLEKYLWSADHVFSRHRQGGDVHGDAAVHVECPNQEEAASTHDSSEEKRDHFNQL